jgi:hypothetical protein
MDRELIKKRQAEMEVFKLAMSFKKIIKKAAVDEYMKEYYEKYFGDYGKELVRRVDEIAPSKKKKDEIKTESPGWEGTTGYREMKDKKSSARKNAKIKKVIKRIEKYDKKIAEDLKILIEG